MPSLFRGGSIAFELGKPVFINGTDNGTLAVDQICLLFFRVSHHIYAPFASVINIYAVFYSVIFTQK
jgi:hypothetical protein